MSTSSKVQSRGRITLPAQLRLVLGLEPGDEVEFVETAPGHYAVAPRAQEAALLKASFTRKTQVDVPGVDHRQLDLPL